MAITYLFGAGAEALYHISSGAEFANDVVGDKYNTLIEKYIKDRLSKIDKNNFYPKYKNIPFNEDSILKTIIRNENLKKFNQEKNSKKSFDIDVDEKYKMVKDDKEERKKYLSEHLSGYLGLLDEDFFTLIEPKPLGPNRFYRTISCYYRAYFSILKGLLGNELNEDILFHPKEANDKIYNICNKLFNEKESYYSILSKYINKNDYIVTTNYTPFCQIIKEKNNLNDNAVVYTHGKLNLFESPYARCVKDVNEDNEMEDDIYFPFLLLQSGVKPIIESKQIIQYYNFINALNKSNILVVVGYSFSIDDSDIIAMIREFLINKNNKMIYLSYYEKTSEKDLINILRIKEEQANIEVVSIDENDCLIKFEKIIKGLY